jgi:NADH-quinone oxidoreductase subunit L
VGTNPAAYFHAAAGFFFDPLTAVMLCVITCIGFLIIVFAAGYMKGEEGYWRFFAYLGLFIFAMTILVMGDNLVMLYLGWEGVGLCSYLLIGYYYERPAAREAAKKAFLVNRVGDFGFSVGIMLSFLAFGTISYFGQGVGTHTGLLELAMGNHLAGSAALSSFQQWALHWIPLLLMVGAFGKSAQFPLYVWLPDAMEGPTPVSALIHAATMVTAGIYMIARCGTLFVGNPLATNTIALVGCFTALFAATIALRQFDLKKVFAYSTISQLGFMFAAVGALAPVAGMFHLVTHAFFKALLFLSSGVVMHAMGGELDMRKMSGLKRVLPITNIVMLVGCLALAGFPAVSGFFSKDEIIGADFPRHWILGASLLLAAFMTAYYTFRLYFRVFWGPLVVPEAPAPAHGHGHEAHEHAAASNSAIATGAVPASGVDEGQTHHQPGHSDHAHGDHNHEPWIMMAPLVILAIGAVFVGYMDFPFHNFGKFIGHSPSLGLSYHLAAATSGADISPERFGQEVAGQQPETEYTVMIISGVISLAGIGLAFYLHLLNRTLSDQIARALQPLTGLIENKYYVDEIYQALIVEPLRALGRWLWAVDRWVVDGVVNLVGGSPQVPGWILKLTVQRGYLQGYAAAMILGIVVVLLCMFF